jgi:GAF domain-containing protein
VRASLTSSSDIGRVLAAAARALNQSEGLDETLQAVAETARASIPGFDQVGVSTLSKTGRLRTRAASGHLVHVLDATQYELDEGPCVAALRESEMVVAPRIGCDMRWPRYAPAAVSLGLRSQLGVKLTVDAQGTVAGLNLYSTVSDDVSPEAEATAELFATHAAIALENARERHTLNQALQTRKIIGQAIGIVMERYGTNEDRAFAYLVRESSHGNTKLRDIAQKLVHDTNGSSS